MAIRRKTKAAQPVAPAADDALRRYTTSLFPIVGIGASAGGIEAFTELLRNLPEAPGMAFVLMQHQEPTHRSMLAQIVTRSTKMSVKSVNSDEQVEPNVVYVGPAQGQLIIEDGVLRLMSMVSTTLPIDTFLRSLAEDQGSRAIAVILSGAASDGAAGAKAVKAEGGITFAQDESAKFDSMPKSAIASGTVDFVLAPKQIAKELVRIGHHSYVTSGLGAPGRFDPNEMAKVYALLRGAHDVDFSHYKPTTIERRVRRRMAIHRSETLSDYLNVLHGGSAEIEQLYTDMLIRVTGFFRDPVVFETLQRTIVPELMKDRTAGNPVRVWVPGCATGEEVYSLAISLLELTDQEQEIYPIQIFGTDISDAAVDQARSGVYPASVENEVSPDRLRRFFTKTNGTYRVTKSVRDCCIFARQNLTRDPPFSKLDLISCRNVMIYLGAPLQRKIMSIFHYALRPEGYLLLGSSETIGNYGDLFGIIDRRQKIYQKKTVTGRLTVEFEPTLGRERFETVRHGGEEATTASVLREADRVLLGRYAPAGVLINQQMDIVQFRGRVSTFLEPSPGVASLNILKMAKEGLLPELRAAIQAARRIDGAVRREGIRLKVEGGTTLVNVEVLTVASEGGDHYQLVVFEHGKSPELDEKKTRGRGKAPKKGESESRELQRMRRELDATREYLQSIIEEQEAMNEELRSANEEIQSSNEELQSTNEELETAKEELQSSNEELTSLNEELETRNQEMTEVNNDLINILGSIEDPIVILDGALKIRRFNPAAQRALKLVASDLGTPIGEFETTLRFEGVDDLVRTVIETLEVRETEIHDRAGRRFSLRVRPYKTGDNKIDGAVMILMEIEESKKKR